MPIPCVNTNSNYHLMMLWENQKASYYLYLKSLFLGQRDLKNREKFQKKKKTEKEKEKENVRRAKRERERERERGEEEEDEVAAAKSVHDPDSWIFLQVHTFFFFFQI